jgi:hypothetical protein
VLISWSYPIDNGSPVTGYIIYLRQSDNSTYTVNSNCDGSTSEIKLARSCSVPIEVLRATPFNLNWGANVFAKVVAFNVFGNSAISDSGSQAIILTNPSAPQVLAEVTAARSATSITLSWQPGLSDGGSPVIDYTVNYD